MKNIKTLVLMQLRDKLDFSFLKSTKQTIFKVVLSIIKFAIITALIYFGFYVISFLRITSQTVGIPHNFLSLIVTFMLTLSVIVCAFGLVKTLYHAKDNALLFTMPTSRTAVFTSKLIVYFIYELIRNAYYLLPLFLAYGIINGLPIVYYLMLPIALILITCLVVVVSALLSIPLVYIINTIKQYRLLEYITTALIVGCIVWVLVSLISAIPADLDILGNWGTTFWAVQDFLNLFVNQFNPFYWIMISIVGSRYAGVNTLFTLEYFLSLLGIIVMIFIIGAITYLLVRPLFFKMASKPFEYKKKEITKYYKNTRLSIFFSTVKKEFLMLYRTPAKFYGLLILVIGLPIAILLLNKIYSAIDTRLAGIYMSVAFNFLLILLIALSSNINVAHIYSEEGASAYLNKTNPQNYLSTLTAKLFINASSMTISLIVTTIIFATFAGYGVWDTILLFIIFESVYLAHLLWSAECDIMNPQTTQYQTTGAHVSNPNDIKSSVLTFVLSALFAFITYFLIPESPDIIWYKIALIAIAFLALRVWLYVNKIKVYYKEK